MTASTDHVTGIGGGIVVGSDGSKGSRIALARAVEEARAHGLPLHIVRAWTITSAPRPESWRPGYVPSSEEFAEAVRAELAADCSTVVAGVADVKISWHVVRGQSAQHLIEASKDASMLVVGARGRGGFAGLVLGSTTDQVIRHAHCPVLVVPHAHVKE